MLVSQTRATDQRYPLACPRRSSHRSHVRTWLHLQQTTRPPSATLITIRWPRLTSKLGTTRYTLISHRNPNLCSLTKVFTALVLAWALVAEQAVSPWTIQVSLPS